MIRVFVLGGTGSIGGAIVEALHKRNHQVLGLVRSAKAREQLQEAGATGDVVATEETPF